MNCRGGTPGPPLGWVCAILIVEWCREEGRPPSAAPTNSDVPVRQSLTARKAAKPHGGWVPGGGQPPPEVHDSNRS
jgi:hypothetical protein